MQTGDSKESPEIVKKRSALPRPPLTRGLSSLRDWGRESVNSCFLLIFLLFLIFSPPGIRSFPADASSLIRGSQGQILFFDTLRKAAFWRLFYLTELEKLCRIYAEVII